MANKIYGEVFSPCFMTEDEFEEGYKSSVFYVEKDYMNEYRKHIAAMGHIANIAKVYILKNWKSVTDWSSLDIKITHGPTGEVTEYYNHDKALQREAERKQYNEKRAKERAAAGKKQIEESSYFRKMFEKMLKEDAVKHNPILEFTEVVLDPTDGDFSITINGDKHHWWISDEEVIIIADYIEEHLKSKQNESTESSTK
jgi:hypothetical protein